MLTQFCGAISIRYGCEHGEINESRSSHIFREVTECKLVHIEYVNIMNLFIWIKIMCK